MSKYRILKCNQKNGRYYYIVQKQYKFLPFIKIWFTKSLDGWEFWPNEPRRFYNIDEAKTHIAGDKAYEDCAIGSTEIIKVE